MKRRLLLILVFGLCIGMTGIVLTGRTNSELGYDVLAAESDAEVMTLTINCSGMTAAAFVPDMTFTVTLPAPAAAIVDYAGTLSGGTVANTDVNSDALASYAAYSLVGATGNINTMMSHPAVKIAGLQCQAATAKSELAVYTASDETAININIVDFATTTFNPSVQVDDHLVGTQFYVFSSETFAEKLGTELADGSDADSETNGEIQFSSTAAAAVTQGGMRLIVSLDITDYASNAKTQVYTYLFTPEDV